MHKIILDSGAYTAWAQKKPISLDNYIKFVKKYSKFIYHVVNLDAIPGDFGRVAGQKEREASAALGWENMEKMGDAGIDTIHVYHQGESAVWLDRMIDRCKYIGISPANDRTTTQKRQWLDKVFCHMISRKVVEKAQTHGFGMTAAPLICRYPWHTADSTTWNRMAGNGCIFLPHVDRNGKLDFTSSPNIISISERSPKRHQQHKHFKTLGTGLVYEAIVKYLATLNVDIEALGEDYKARCFVNVKYFQMLAAQPFDIAQINDYRREVLCEEEDFGGRKEIDQSYVNSFKGKKVNVVFAVNPTRAFNEVLCKAKVDLRLLSYYYLNLLPAPGEILQSLAETGLPPPPKKKKGKMERK